MSQNIKLNASCCSFWTGNSCVCSVCDDLFMTCRVEEAAFNAPETSDSVVKASSAEIFPFGFLFTYKNSHMPSWNRCSMWALLFQFEIKKTNKTGNYSKVSSLDNKLCFPPAHCSFPHLTVMLQRASVRISAVQNRSDTRSHDKHRYNQRTSLSDSWPQSLDLSLHHMGLFSFPCNVTLTVYVFP